MTIAKQRTFLLAGAGVLLVAAAGFVLAGCGGGGTAMGTTTPPPNNLIPSLQPYPTPSGTESTYSATGNIDPGGIFFQALGTNTRSCASCHKLSEGMGLSAASAQALFTSSNGNDPLFLAVDGANCPTAAAGNSTGHSLIVNNGLIRIAEALPAGAQFTMAVAQDPYGCAASTNGAGQTAYSVYRRPLPATSLTMMSQVMWDGRFTGAPLNAAATLTANLETDLSAQAGNAITTHEQGTAAPTAAQLSELVAFEEGLFTAEATDTQAGPLTGSGATGGAAALAAQNYYPGINDAFGQDPKGAAFNKVVFTLFAAWEGSSNPALASIARGEDLFNSAPMQITDVHGLNDNPALGSPAVLMGTCGTCHDAPSIGTHSLPLTMDIGTSHVIASETDANIIGGLQALTAPNLPVYQISGCTNAGGNAVVYVTTDPGVASRRDNART